jgi:hypothetical protein
MGLPVDSHHPTDLGRFDIGKDCPPADNPSLIAIEDLGVYKRFSERTMARGGFFSDLSLSRTRFTDCVSCYIAIASQGNAHNNLQPPSADTLEQVRYEGTYKTASCYYGIAST